MKKYSARTRRGTLLVLFFLGVLISHATPADTAFEKLARECIEDLLRSRPERATELGDHRFDDQLTDYSPAALKARAESLQRQIAALAAIDASGLTGAN